MCTINPNRNAEPNNAQINFPGIPMHEEDAQRYLQDLSDGKIASPGPIAVLCASPPCQPFSNANPGGKNDKDNKEQLHVVGKALEILKPEYMVSSLAHGNNRKWHLTTMRTFV